MHNAGVPDLWLEDALQDVRIALWKQPDRSDVMVIRSAAVDAARHYGDRTRSGQQRLRCTSLDAIYEQQPSFDLAAPEPTIPDDAAIRHRSRTLFILTAAERDLLIRFLKPHPRFSTAEHGRLQLLRRRLRAAANGEIAIPARLWRFRRICQCGETFWSDDARRGWCTQQCYKKFDKRRLRRDSRPHGRPCVVCGTPLTYGYWSSRKRKRFCGNACRMRLVRRKLCA